MKSEDIINEYKRAEIHYKAMAALIKAENIKIDGTAPSVEPVQPVPVQPEPISLEPGIVYNGDTDITLKPGEKIDIIVYFNGVTSAGEYIISPNMPSTAYSIAAEKTAYGYKDIITVTARTGNSGAFKIYLKSKPEDYLLITITTKG